MTWSPGLPLWCGGAGAGAGGNITVETKVSRGDGVISILRL